MHFNSSKPLLINPDVLIIGGGAAGIAAAAGASQMGASVTLVEKNAFAGGKATASCVGTICGLYYRSETASPTFVHRGFPQTFSKQLAEASGSQPVQYKNGLHFLPYNHFDFTLLCDEWLMKTTQSVCFHTLISGVDAEEKEITSVKAIMRNSAIEFNAGAIVDTSGENLISGMLNLPGIRSDYYQAAAHVFQLSGVTATDNNVVSFSMIRAIQKGIGNNSLESYFERVSIVPGSLQNGNVLIKLPLPVLIENNAYQYSELELFSRNAIMQLFKFLKSECKIFSASQITFMAAEAGVRSGPRNEGKYMLTGKEVLGGFKCSDSIARGSWPVEYWEPGKNVRMDYFEMNDYYDIPSGVLQSNEVNNLFFGGRNISADDTAIASARVIGTCFATGFSAGVMAACHASGKSNENAISAIQQSLFSS